MTKKLDEKFALTPKQEEAMDVLAGDATHIMLFGGSRSGKTFLLCRAVAIRALKAPESRHAILRFRFNHVKNSVVLDTWPKVMKLCFPGVKYTISKTDWYCQFENGSQVWFGGLDDKERSEKILGMEFVTIYLNECSQIPQSSRDIVITRLAQQVDQLINGHDPVPMQPRMYYDCVSGDTVLPGHDKTIKELAEIGEPISVLTTHGWTMASAPWKNGEGDLFKVATDSGKQLTVTASHKFWTTCGWTTVDMLAIGQKILCTDQHQNRCDGQYVHGLNQITEDSGESCCKYRHQRDEQSPLPLVFFQENPASSSCAKERNLFSLRRDEPDFHKVRQHPHAVQHNHHSQDSHGLPLQMSSVCSLSKESFFCLPTSLLSQQKHQSFQQCLLGCHHCKAVLLSQPVALCSSFSSDCLDVEKIVASIYKQSQRYSCLSQQFLDLNSQQPIKSSVDLQALDTPIFDDCCYESVVDIRHTTTDSYYTMMVPIVNHFIAGGIVNHNCNPPSKAHWSYRIFIKKQDLDTKQTLKNPDDYAYFKINPLDNAENLSGGYLDTLRALGARLRKRFLDGDYSDATANGLFDEATIDKWRVTSADDAPDMVRIVVAVDPSGSGDTDNADNDAIGIVVAGLGQDGNGYLMADLTVKAGPSTWGKVVTDAYDRFMANTVVGEVNYGGAMVEHVIQTARPRTPYKSVIATRNKAVRAEPVASLTDQGKIRHIGFYPELEEEMSGMTTNGYVGERSPNRADAYVWAFYELFGEIVTGKTRMKIEKPIVQQWQPAGNGMGMFG